MYGGYYDDEKQVPNAIFDLNYWDRSIINKLYSIDTVHSKLYEFEEINNGYYIRLQKEPIDTSNKAHLKLQKVQLFAGLPNIFPPVSISPTDNTSQRTAAAPKRSKNRVKRRSSCHSLSKV